MAEKYERGKWNDASELPDPQSKGSIYFIIENGEKLTGTYLGYSQYIYLDEDIYQEGEVKKWIIRDRKVKILSFQPLPIKE